MSHPILDVRNLTVEFTSGQQRVTAVRDISFQVQPGQTLGIVGESGSGKSVSCLAAMGLVPTPPGHITQGEIWFQPRSSGATPAQPINLLTLRGEDWCHYRGVDMGMIFQEPMSSLNPVFTCGYQVMEAIQHHEPVSKREAQGRTIALFQEVQLLPGDEELKEQLRADGLGSSKDDRALERAVQRHKRQMLNRYPHQLSGGQRQRVMIAIALACNPRLLIADEPTTALDVTIQAAILDLLRSLRDRRHMAMIFVSHDLGVIAEIADHVAVMYQGELVETGSVQQVFHHPKHPYTKGLLACRPRLDLQIPQLPTISDFMEVTQGEDGRWQVQEREDAPDLSQFLQPATPTSGIVDVAPPSEAPLLNVQNLRVTFPLKTGLGLQARSFVAVDDVSFQVWPGETLGLVGESGCGKSTLARALLRLLPIAGGQILFGDQDLTRLGQGKTSALALRRLRRDLQIVFQDPYGSLNPRMTVGEAVMEPMLIHGFNKNPKAHQDGVAHLLERVGLGRDAMERYPHEFSGGQRQRVCIARALALNPRFIICDESVSALDVSVQAQVLNLLKTLQQDYNLTYIFISHDLSVVKFMSDRILVMNRGRVEEIAPAHQIYTNPQSDYTRKLIAAIPSL